MSTTTTTTTTEPITASNILTLFPDVSPTLTNPHPSSDPNGDQNGDLTGYDAEQIRLMDEICIVVSTADAPIATASKKTCHLMTNIRKGLLHRAFSVFLFDPVSHNLLLQQRASEKITFPDMWTNTCCSHPLGIPGETGAGLEESVAGVKRAAVRKLGQELGVRAEEVPESGFDFLTRIHYEAGSDGVWGEHESELLYTPTSLLSISCIRTEVLTVWGTVDYILFTIADVTLEPNPNEVRDTRYVSAAELKEMFEDATLKFTPWFKLICNSMLFEWWEHLARGGLPDKYKGETEIRRMLPEK
jgi:isopentenyl-diphosphate Delta-isomerase